LFQIVHGEPVDDGRLQRLRLPPVGRREWGQISVADADEIADAETCDDLRVTDDEGSGRLLQERVHRQAVPGCRKFERGFRRGLRVRRIIQRLRWEGELLRSTVPPGGTCKHQARDDADEEQG